MSQHKPKRDFLPSQKADHVTRALDESFERGFSIGRAAGLEHACKLLRDAGIPNIGDILVKLTSEKYR
jgi:hypothetical protein